MATLPPLTAVLDLMPAAVCVLDAQGMVLYVNASFEDMFGYAADEMIAQRMFDLVHPDDRTETIRQADEVMSGKLQRHFRNRYLHKDGHVVDIQWSARWLPDYQVRIGVGHEVTELRRRERELEYRADHDALTALPNRERLRSALQETLAHALRSDDAFALLYLDVDDFKRVNDCCGHEVGDRVLREMAERLRASLRQGDLAARVGGDEFVVLLPGCVGDDAVRAVVENLRASLGQPYELPNGRLLLNASIGTACFPADGDDADKLVEYADRAMYRAKQKRAQLEFFPQARGASERS